MSIGIIGAGISGLHLALRLQQLGVDASLYAPHGPDEIRAGRPLNFVTRFASTVDRERQLGVAHWDSPEYQSPRVHLRVEGPDGFSFRGELPRPASSVDFRVYLARLMEDYQTRGGTVTHGTVTHGDLDRLSRRHDLLVVCSGRGATTDLFPRRDDRSPYRQPQRILCGGLFRGIAPPEPPGMSLHMIPGAGEIHAPPYFSLAGHATVLLVEAVPGGPLEPLAHLDRNSDPQGFDRAVLAMLAEHAPALRERVDEREFGLTRPVDLLQGAVTPVVRQGWARLPGGGHALALGDAWITNDPITAQGANLGSRCAFIVADAIRDAEAPYDGRFCAAVEGRMWAYARHVVDWTNTFLAPPLPHLGELLAAAAGDQQVADAFAANLDDPPAMWRSIADAEHTARFLAAARSAAVPAGAEAIR